MYNQITAEEALTLNNCVFIDVRSPKEHTEATIPNSINIPIFTDSEREEIGRIYKQKSKDEAKALGLRFASPKLESIYNRVLELSEKYENIVIFCWRGGMRSTSVCNILSFLVSSNIYQLKGGYKSYRKMVNHFLEEDIQKFTFMVVHGLTGVGKTKILNKLEEKGVQTLDLEDIAKNAGSVFGSLLFRSSPPSQKNFEAEVFTKLYNSKYKYIVVESESKRIGSVNIPSTMFEQMEDSYHFLINTSIENRIVNIINDYIKSQKDIYDIHLKNSIIDSILHLKKRLGIENINMLIDKINNDDFTFVIEFLIKEYYDPLYKYSIEKIDSYDLNLHYDNIDDAVQEIYDYIEKMFDIGKE